MITYKQLESQNEENLKSSAENLSSFDKNFFIVCAGIFAFTVTFIKDIVKVEQALILWLLIWSWILFAASMAFTIIGYLISASRSELVAYRIGEAILEKKRGIRGRLNPNLIPYHEEDPVDRDVDDYAYYSSKLSRFLNIGLRWASVLSFILGLFFLCFFVGINFWYSNDHRSASEKAVAASGKTDPTPEKTPGANPVSDPVSTPGAPKENGISHIVPSTRNPVYPLSDSLKVRYEYSSSSSTVLYIRPDTIYLKAIDPGPGNPSAIACGCPPDSHLCKDSCRKKKKSSR